MILTAVLIQGFVLLGCLVLAPMFGGRFPARWWLLRLGVVPLIGFGLMGYVYLTATPVPLDYDEAVHGDSGRRDFLVAVVYGIALPLAWLAIALPGSVAYALWKRRR